ncbi:hypothetical protein HK405_007339 [Cladochytrium tenue]|nr:hypothetical protein HK405_007339 [Cladochytrium tenue]
MESECADVFMTPEKHAFLKAHGYVVIEGVVPTDLCSRTVAEMRDYQTSCPDDATFLASGVNTSTQLPSLMDIRQHPNLHRAFAELWGTPQLRCSLDRWCYMRANPYRFTEHSERVQAAEGAPEPEEPVWRDGLGWHTDAGPSDFDESFPGFVQGLVNLIDCTLPCDGGFRVIDGGHLAHRRFFETHRTHSRGNFHNFPEKFIKEIATDGSPYLEDHLRTGGGETGGGDGPTPMLPVHVTCRPGDLVLFYSTAPHGNLTPVAGDPRANDRACAYIAMAPARFESPVDLEKRLTAFRSGAATSHRSVRGVVIFKNSSALRGTKKDAKTKGSKGSARFAKPVDSEQLTGLGRKLVGFENWDA